MVIYKSPVVPRETRMAVKADPALLKPQVLGGPAVAQDKSVKDFNHSEPPVEDGWLDQFDAQSEAFADCETEFLATLRGNIKT